ncbi:MAG: 50S ribosomal protein L15 [Gammaproteobacteria bacterium]|nr:MAG: 50S ribosomal protein L15 [Gammaproteobacteria bacterium]
MQLNTLSPSEGSRRERRRVGRGIGSGFGKTCGRGHKGQKSRSGGYHKVGFEGGQMPIQRRLPKRGFRSAKQLISAQIRLSELNAVEGDIVSLAALKEAGLIHSGVKFAKVFASGAVNRAVILKGVAATAGAKQAIESAGGSVEA